MPLSLANPGYNFPRTPKTPKTPLTKLTRIMSFPDEDDDDDDDDEEKKKKNAATSSAAAETTTTTTASATSTTAAATTSTATTAVADSNGVPTSEPGAVPPPSDSATAILHFNAPQFAVNNRAGESDSGPAGAGAGAGTGGGDDHGGPNRDGSEYYYANGGASGAAAGYPMNGYGGDATPFGNAASRHAFGVYYISESDSELSPHASQFSGSSRSFFPSRMSASGRSLDVANIGSVSQQHSERSLFTAQHSDRSLLDR